MNVNKVLMFLPFCWCAVEAQVVTNTGVITINPKTTMSVVSNFDNQNTGTLWNDGELSLLGDFNNDGLVTFSPTIKGGNTRFDGTSKQIIRGTEVPEFQNVMFNNSAAQPAIELHNEINISGKADFTQGIVNNQDFGGMVVFEQNGEHINTNTSSFATGEVMKKGGASFMFPVGAGENFRHSKITGSKDAANVFLGNYFSKNSNSSWPHSKKIEEIDVIDDKEYWTLEKKAGKGDVMLTLSWDEYSTTPGDMANGEEENLHIVRWSTDKNMWVDEGGVVDVSNRTVTTPVSVSGYGVFTLAKVFAFLPCKLVVYNAVSPNGDGMNDYFKVEGLNACSISANSVQIFNRWGVEVYQENNYGEDGKLFRGYSNKLPNKLLPAGTYFYIINMNFDAGGKSQSHKKSGYLYLN